MLSKKAKASRRSFRYMYSPTTVRVVKMTAEGRDAHYISDREDIGVPNVAAYKANLTRGTYWPFADVDPNDGEVYGDCDF